MHQGTVSKIIDRLLGREKLTVRELAGVDQRGDSKVDKVRLVTGELVLEFYQDSLKLGYIEIFNITGGAPFAETIFKLKAKPWMTAEALGVAIDVVEEVMMLFGHTTPKRALFPGKSMRWDQAEHTAMAYEDKRAVETGLISPALMAKNSFTAQELIAGRTYEEMAAENATSQRQLL